MSSTTHRDVYEALDQNLDLKNSFDREGASHLEKRLYRVFCLVDDYLDHIPDALGHLTEARTHLKDIVVRMQNE